MPATDFTSRIRVVPDEDGPRYHCFACRDEPAAWRMFWCAGLGEFRATSRELVGKDAVTSQCGRRKDHVAHMFVQRCGCSDTNPIISEHRRRLEEFRVRKKADTKR